MALGSLNDLMKSFLNILHVAVPSCTFVIQLSAHRNALPSNRFIAYPTLCTSSLNFSLFAKINSSFFMNTLASVEMFPLKTVGLAVLDGAIPEVVAAIDAIVWSISLRVMLVSCSCWSHLWCTGSPDVLGSTYGFVEYICGSSSS